MKKSGKESMVGDSIPYEFHLISLETGDMSHMCYLWAKDYVDAVDEARKYYVYGYRISLPHEIVGGYCIKYAYLPKIAFKVESGIEHPKEYRR